MKKIYGLKGNSLSKRIILVLGMVIGMAIQSKAQVTYSVSGITQHRNSVATLMGAGVKDQLLWRFSFSTVASVTGYSFMTLQNVNVSFAGTNINDLQNIRLYRTQASRPIASSAIYAPGTVTGNNILFDLPLGALSTFTGATEYNLFADISPTATASNIIKLGLASYVASFPGVVPAVVTSGNITSPLTTITGKMPSGTYTIDPTISTVGGFNYKTFSAFFTDYNAKGMTEGAFTLKVADDQTHIVSANQITFLESGSPTKPILVTRSNTGANKPILEYRSTSSGSIIRLLDAGYITIDGLDMMANASVTAANMPGSAIQIIPYMNNGDYVTIRNCNINFPIGGNNSVIQGDGNSGVTVSSCNFLSLYNNTLVGNANGINLKKNIGNNYLNTYIANNIVQGFSTTGIYLEAGIDVKILNNAVNYIPSSTSNGINGIQLANPVSGGFTIAGNNITSTNYGVFVKALTFTGNVLADVNNNNVTGSLSLDGTTSTNVWNNIITNARNGYTTSNLANINGNVIYRNNTVAGIGAATGLSIVKNSATPFIDAEVINNIIRNYTNTGVNLQSTTGTSFYNNLVSSDYNSAYAIFLQNMVGTSFVNNNTVSGGTYGIYISKNASTTSITSDIGNNYLQSFSIAGIYNTGVSNAKISYNDIGGTVMSTPGNNTNLAGIFLTSVADNAHIYGNRIHDLVNLSANTTAGITTGIYIQSANTISGDYIFNNMISNLDAPNSTTAASEYFAARAIQFGDLQKTPVYFYNNSISLTASSRPSSVIWTNGTMPPNLITLKNNIIASNDAGSGNKMVLLATKFGNISMISGTSTKNIYSFGGTNFHFVVKGNPLFPVLTTNSINTFANYTAQKAGEAASYYQPAPFVSATDLHLDPIAGAGAIASGVPVTVPGLGWAGDLLFRDFDYNTRNTSSPTIGADEIVTVVSSVTVSSAGNATSISNYRETLQLSAALLPLNANYPQVVWSVDKPNLASIAGTGSVTGLLQPLYDGVVTVRATADEGSKVYGEFVVTLTNQILVSSIGITPAGTLNGINIKGGSMQLNKLINPFNASIQNVIWSVDNTSIATIDGTGLLQALGTDDGSVTVTATATDVGSVAGMLTLTLTNQVWASSITISPNQSVISVMGDNLQLSAIVLPANTSNPNVIWSVTPGLASISGTGLLQAIANGVITVTATSVDAGGVKGYQVITLTGQFVPVSSILLDGPGGVRKITDQYGSLQILSTVLPADATNPALNWTISNPTFGTISGAGLLQALADGIVTVTATAMDGTNKKASVVITITGQVKVNSIGLSTSFGSTLISTKGGTMQILSTVLPANASDKTILWTSSDPLIATVTNAGLVKAIGDGEVTITGTAADGSGVFGIIQFRITNQVVVTSIVVSSTGGVQQINTYKGNLQMVATVLPSNAFNPAVGWSVAPSSLASISGAGVLHAIGNGVVTVVATALDGSDVTGRITITLSNQVLITGLTITGNNTVNISATSQFSLKAAPASIINPMAAWSVSDETIATIDTNGLLSAIAAGVVTVTATASDGTDISASIVVTVTSAVATGITPLSSELKVEVYPVPNEGSFTIEVGEPSLVSISDLLGNLILSQKINSKEQLKIESKGIFFITISSGQKIIVKKLIIE